MKTVELLLVENVDNLGIVGDVVKVKPGYARNYLLPHGLATVPTPEAVEALAERRREVEAELAALREARSTLIEKLTDYELTIERSANDQGILFGGVSQHDIAEALQAQGFEVEDRYVRLGDKIERLDSYIIPIVIDKDLKTEIKLWVVSDQPLEEEEVTVDDSEEIAVVEGEQVEVQEVEETPDKAEA